MPAAGLQGVFAGVGGIKRLQQLHIIIDQQKVDGAAVAQGKQVRKYGFIVSSMKACIVIIDTTQLRTMAQHAAARRKKRIRHLRI